MGGIDFSVFEQSGVNFDMSSVTQESIVNKGDSIIFKLSNVYQMILYATELCRVEGSCYECIFALIFIIGFA